MSRSFSIWAGFFVLAASAAHISQGHAQQGQPDRRRPPRRFVTGLLLPEQIEDQLGAEWELLLLDMPAVQKELGLSDEDQDRAERLAGVLLKWQRERVQKQKMKEATDAQSKLSEESLTKVNDILTPGQSKRLKQIALQTVGTLGLGAKQIGSQLELTDEQKTEINTIIKNSMTDIRHSFARGQGESREDFQARMEEIRKAVAERDAKLLAVLNEDQRKQFDELQGKPFDISALGSGFGGGYGVIESPDPREPR